MMKEGGKCADGMCCGNTCEGKYGCKCIHHQVKPVLTVLLGATVVTWGLGYLEPETMAVIAGGCVVLIGLMKAFRGMCKCC